MVSRSFKEGKSSSRRRTSVRPSMDADEFINLFHGSDPLGFSRMVCFAKNCERPPEFARFQSCWVFTNIDFFFFFSLGLDNLSLGDFVEKLKFGFKNLL